MKPTEELLEALAACPPLHVQTNGGWSYTGTATVGFQGLRLGDGGNIPWHRIVGLVALPSLQAFGRAYRD